MKHLPLPSNIHADLHIVRRIIRDRIQSQPRVASVLGDTLPMDDTALLRGVLALLSAQFGSYTTERVEHVASTVELIHIAARMHDRLIDQEGRRRGDLSVGAAWEHGVPLMVGDYMYALAAGEMALVSDARAIGYFSEAVKQISEAALSPVRTVVPQDEAEEQYLAYIGGNVASLCEAACMAGSAVCGCSDEQIGALGRYGRNLGLAVQILADADAYQTAPNTNGTNGNTLRQGIITLPLIYAAARNEELATIVDTYDADPARTAQALEQVATYGVPAARAAAQRWRDAALAELASFEAMPAYQPLTAVTYSLIP